MGAGTSGRIGERRERLAVVADFEGDVSDDFKVDGSAGFGSGLKFPLSEGGFGVGVELRVECAGNLDAVDRAVGAHDAVEDDFSLNILFDEIGRVLGIDFANGHGHGQLRRRGDCRRRA